MKGFLQFKLILLYIIFGFLALFVTDILTSHLILTRLEEDASRSLYREATLIADEYLPSYFSEGIDKRAVQSQLSAMRLYLDSSLWFVDQDGKMIVSSSLDGTTAPEQIQDFDPAEIGASRYIVGTYHDYFRQDMITVSAPVTMGFSTKGYLLIHSPVSSLDEKCTDFMVPVYISLFVIYGLAFLLLLAFHFLIYHPLRQISEAAKQYASGNLDYEIPVKSHDEVGYLAASLNYMSSQLKDMKDYQKNFIANVSHDFRSPLTSIKGYVEAMADGTIPPELYGKYLDIIRFEAERLTDLSRDLLTLNEFDTKELLLNRSDFDIQDMIRTTVSSFEGVCTARHISIELLLLPDSVIVYADKGKIQQVLYNLIDNAIKFSEPGSPVTVEVSERNEHLFISVKDKGIGIPKKDLNKIWERFYKSDLSRGKDKKGTGLGLAIVKEIIQAHDEYINVISTEGVGTEFIFSLPRS